MAHKYIIPIVLLLFSSCVETEDKEVPTEKSENITAVDAHKYNINTFTKELNLTKPIIPLREGAKYVEYVPAPIMCPDSTTYLLTKGHDDSTNYLSLSIRESPSQKFKHWGVGVDIGNKGDWDKTATWDSWMGYDTLGKDTIRVLYKGLKIQKSDPDKWIFQIGYAYAPADNMPTTLTKYSRNPVLTKKQVEEYLGFEVIDIAPNDVVKKADTLYLYFSVSDSNDTYSIYYATSQNYIDWTIQGKVLAPENGFNMHAYISVLQLSDGFYYGTYDKRKSNSLNGKISSSYTSNLKEEFKSLKGDFISIQENNKQTTLYTGRVYAGKWLKHWNNWTQPIAVRGNWEYYYSASDLRSPRSDRAFMTKVKPYSEDKTMHSRH